ncbi:hypothetical protein N7474_010034 [Penicillium riverlandense]|uniref:uncharacterized protein n=1 Tax=Penicillium riverlandense TaxID=1903569 RepID=UPI00254733A1|nr:uncharacterized protein N7474_010034 [Penicillium riverlandense]KAJ5808765.1 hypothetical protein N7474_010034 [Penicillium riverlandense]
MEKKFRSFRSFFRARSSNNDPTGTGNGANTSASKSVHSVTTHREGQTSSLSPSSTVVIDSGNQKATQKPKRKAVDIPPDELWHQAYDGLKTEEPELLQGYERLLSTELPLYQTDKVIGQSQKNKLSQMNLLLEAGLNKTAKISKIEGKFGEAIDVARSVSEPVGVGLNTVPAAAAAWAGVCVALEILSNPITEAEKNREGITKVVLKMKWYSSLSKIFDQKSSMANDDFTELREQLAERILCLYKAILQYIIETICSHHRKQGVRFLRDLVKLDDWDGKLSGVEGAEAAVKAAAEDIGIQQTSSYLELLVNMRRSETDDAIMEKCCVSDMDADIELLQGLKDKLLPESYEWALHTKEYINFTDWHHGNSNRLLWMRGDAGKGKTMLLMGIVEDLKARLETRFDECCLSYFFCRGTSDNVNTATSVLRGLIWMLLRQEKSLIHHLDAFKGNQSNAFNDGSAFFKLKKIFLQILQDSSLGRVYFVIDALDECKREEPGLGQLLNLVTETTKNDKVKWLLSSRNEHEIETFLGKGTTHFQLSLEVNSAAVKHAVNAYIDRKVSDLDEKYRTDYKSILAPKLQSQYEAERAKQLENELSQTLGQFKGKLKEKADGTFLWVALVMKELKDVSPDELLQRIEQIPSGLDGIYTRMLVSMNSSNYAAKCKKLLLIMTSAYRPLYLDELLRLANFTDFAVPPQLVKRCGLLALGDDDNIVYFVHQSAKDYLVQAQGPEVLSSIFPHGHTEGHHMIVTQSLEDMKKLKRDIYGRKHPGLSIDELEDSKKYGALLKPLRYSCVYWADHLSDSETNFQSSSFCDGGIVNEFWKTCLLYWIEALSLMGNYSVAVSTSVKIIKLLSNLLLQPQFLPLVRDSHRFILSARGVVERYPLQIYASALVFAPTGSLTRKAFEHEEPDWLVTKPLVDPEWSQCIQTLYGHSAYVTSVACSPSGTLIASGSWDHTIRVWEEESGHLLKILVGHRDVVSSVSFSPDGTLIASASRNGTIKIWDVNNGECLRTFSISKHHKNRVVFSPTGQIAAISEPGTLKIWDPHRGECLNSITSFDGRSPAAFISSERLAVYSSERQIETWDVVKGTCIRVFGHADSADNISVSADKQMVSGSRGNKLEVWGQEGVCLLTLGDPHDETDRQLNRRRGYSTVAFLPNGNLISGSRDGSVNIWDLHSGDLLNKMTGHTKSVKSVACTTRGNVVSGGVDNTVRLWNPIPTHRSSLERPPLVSWAFAFSAGRIASGYYDGTVRIWNSNDGRCLKILDRGKEALRSNSLAFSLDGTLASGSDDGTISVWDSEGDECLHTLEAHDKVKSVVFSPDGTIIVSGLSNGEIQIWQSTDGVCLTRFRAHDREIRKVSMSSCGMIASAGFYDGIIKLWQTNGALLKTVYSRHLSPLDGLTFSCDGTRLLSHDKHNFIVWDTSSGERHQQVKSREYSLEKASELLGPGPRHHYALDYDQEWITYEGEKVLWLPAEYRPYYRSWAVDRADAGNHLIISNDSGRMLIYGFSTSQTPL